MFENVDPYKEGVMDITNTTVLLVDDHTILRDGVRALIESTHDLEVIGEAANGKQAIEQAQRRCPDVVVMDIAMPQLGGIEATRRIRQLCPESHVLMLSMFMSSEHVFRALQAGAEGYILKESAGTELVEAIRAVRSGHRFLSHRLTENLIDGHVLHDRKVSPIQSLSRRERDVLQQVVEGNTNAVIARNLSISPKSVETYRARILKKLGLKDTVELVKFAMRHGLIS
jgi:DNA-binding NarL/FixJ family response regulator